MEDELCQLQDSFLLFIQKKPFNRRNCKMLSLMCCKEECL